MDLSSPDFLLKVLTILSPVLLPLLFRAAKMASDLRSNRITQGKHSAELVQVLTEWASANGQPDIHPMAIQAQFHAAFGGYPYRLPDGQEILDFVKDEALATLRNALEFAACLEFVAYSKLAAAFVPRAPWTAKKLPWARRGAFFLYLIVAGGSVAIVTTPGFGPWRYALAAVGFTVALFLGWWGGRLLRAMRLLADTQMEGGQGRLERLARAR